MDKNLVVEIGKLKPKTHIGEITIDGTKELAIVLSYPKKGTLEPALVGLTNTCLQIFYCYNTNPLQWAVSINKVVDTKENNPQKYRIAIVGTRSDLEIILNSIKESKHEKILTAFSTIITPISDINRKSFRKSETMPFVIDPEFEQKSMPAALEEERKYTEARMLANREQHLWAKREMPAPKTPPPISPPQAEVIHQEGDTVEAIIKPGKWEPWSWKERVEKEYRSCLYKWRITKEELARDIEWYIRSIPKNSGNADRATLQKFKRESLDNNEKELTLIYDQEKKTTKIKYKNPHNQDFIILIQLLWRCWILDLDNLV